MAKKKPTKAKKTTKKAAPKARKKAPAPGADLRRNINPGDITDGNLTKVLEAARSAPSAANLQPWVFLIVRDAEMKAEVASLGEGAGRQPYRELFWREDVWNAHEVLNHCGALIIVFGENRMPYWRESCWSALSRMEAAALDEALVTIVYQPGETRLLCDLFHTPQMYTPVAVIALGNPDGTRPVKTRKPLETMAVEFHTGGENLPLKSEDAS